MTEILSRYELNSSERKIFGKREREREERERAESCGNILAVRASILIRNST